MSNLGKDSVLDLFTFETFELISQIEDIASRSHLIEDVFCYMHKNHPEKKIIQRTEGRAHG